MPLYASCLQQSPKVNNADIRKWDEELDVEVILLWRYSQGPSKCCMSRCFSTRDYTNLFVFVKCFSEKVLSPCEGGEHQIERAGKGAGTPEEKRLVVAWLVCDSPPAR